MKDMLHTDANGEIYYEDTGSHTVFTQVCETDGGAHIDEVSIPHHVLLKLLLSMVDTQIVLKGGSPISED